MDYSLLLGVHNVDLAAEEEANRLANPGWLKIKFGILLPKLFRRWEKNCSSDRENLVKFEAEGREFAKILRSLEQFIWTVKGQNNFWQQNVFLTCYWRFPRSNKLEQLELKLEKIIGI